ncbi:DUF1287 domain-containing protein [Hyphococcus flavus]|uniref:DUF1287 domain-containing protein n=1 Tax=Hyphococcus flavus TaxID=1866326 RepID=A0AAE9ZI56_9PROT|nr:DUF1287 domain-containing protein [Hyphococcus flavus]WDI33082.1 DUF1287 domain-containing protein [Hyphococcus flavus]
MRITLAAAIFWSAFVAVPVHAETFGERLARAAIERTSYSITYDNAYVRMSYPMGDVAPDRGVCADVVVRSLRALEIDLQQLVHEDMAAAFSAYPTHWGLTRPDTNIDHRRVPNLEKFLTRKGARIAISDDPSEYLPGDIVAWNLRGDAGWLPHIGIVTDRIGRTGRPMVVHNIGAGPKLEDVLFDWPMTGHYRMSDAIFDTDT